MFFDYKELSPGALLEERHQLADRIADGLPKSEIVGVERRNLKVRLPDDGVVEGDIGTTGFTVYLGGFDWVTFPTPQHFLHKFPQFLPLPQPIHRPEEE